MKQYAYLLATGLLLFALGSCSEGGEEPIIPDETGDLVLKASRPDVLPNSDEVVKFTIVRGSLDKTAEAKVWQIAADGTETEVTTKTFAAKTLGTYTFEARYTDPKNVALVSPKVTINAIEAPKEEFLRRIAVQQFTSAQCKYCPDMTDNIVNLRKQEKWKDRLIHLTFHSSSMGPNDPMITPVSDQYTTDLKIEGLPSAILDLMPDTHTGAANNVNIVDQFNRMLTDFPAMCGVAITSNYDATTRQLTINTKVKATRSNEYRILVFLLEDEIRSFQLGAPNGSMYKHNDTVREFVSKSAYGDKLGMINTNTDKEQIYTVTLNEKWKAEKMHVVACAIHEVNGNVYINNSAICPLIDGKIDYTYNPAN